MPPKENATDKATDVWIVLLCGLPGSGKSTLRKKLVENGWAYANQDEMGTADACEKALVKALRLGKSCVVDRCNVTSSERRFSMQHANNALVKGKVKGVTLHFEAVWMATPPEVCKQRAGAYGPMADARERHETLSAENAGDVIDKFCKGLRIPQRSGQEPYEAVHFVADDDDAALVVQRYANPAAVDVSVGPSRAAVPVATFAQAAAAAAEIDDSVPAEVFVVRHGERADRAKGRDEGYPDDAALTKEGRETAKRAGIALRSLAGSQVVAVYTSPFFRCLQTANEIAAELGCVVRIEPGLSELCTDKLFDGAPLLRSPAESITRALQRVEVDLSEPPIEPMLPKWPEEARDANVRVVRTAKTLAERHAGQAICLVCHSHSVVEISRHMPNEGGGATGSTAGYCAMSHISHTGVLQRCLDVSYLKEAASQVDIKLDEASVAYLDPATGCWADGWCWKAEVECEPLDMLLERSFDEVLAKYTQFREIFDRGSQEQKDKWRQGWHQPDDDMRRKLQKAYDRGIFEDA